MVGKDGKTLRETLQVVERMTHRTPPELINPAPEPQLLAYLWQFFLMLHNKRPSGFGATPIAETEIQAFQANRRIRMNSFELDAISRLDQLALTKDK